MPTAPALVLMAEIRCEVAPVVSLGPAPTGERRYVLLSGGTVSGPELRGRIVEGGIDWQLARSDGVLEIFAHYVIRTPDDGLIEVRSEGLRHGPPEVMQRMARGETVPHDAYFFRTFVRFCTGAAGWQHLNRVMAIAVGRREPRAVALDLFRLT